MRVLLDESLPRRLKRELTQHDVKTVPEVGWAGRKNGELLRLAEPVFDVFVTMDGNLPFQQNLGALEVCVIVLEARSNDLGDLRPLAPALRSAVDEAKPGQVVTIAA